MTEVSPNFTFIGTLQVTLSRVQEIYCIDRWHISMLFLLCVAWEISDDLICEDLENGHFYS